VNFINKQDTKKPMYLYLAHYAHHRPLEAPQNRIAMYCERHQVVYEVLREKRYENLKKTGFIA